MEQPRISASDPFVLYMFLDDMISHEVADTYQSLQKFSIFCEETEGLNLGDCYKLHLHLLQTYNRYVNIENCLQYVENEDPEIFRTQNKYFDFVQEQLVEYFKNNFGHKLLIPLGTNDHVVGCLLDPEKCAVVLCNTGWGATTYHEETTFTFSAKPGGEQKRPDEEEEEVPSSESSFSREEFISILKCFRLEPESDDEVPEPDDGSVVAPPKLQEYYNRRIRKFVHSISLFLTLALDFTRLSVFQENRGKWGIDHFYETLVQQKLGHFTGVQPNEVFHAYLFEHGPEEPAASRSALLSENWCVLDKEDIAARAQLSGSCSFHGLAWLILLLQGSKDEMTAFEINMQKTTARGLVTWDPRKDKIARTGKVPNLKDGRSINENLWAARAIWHKHSGRFRSELKNLELQLEVGDRLRTPPLFERNDGDDEYGTTPTFILGPKRMGPWTSLPLSPSTSSPSLVRMYRVATNLVVQANPRENGDGSGMSEPFAAALSSCFVAQQAVCSIWSERLEQVESGAGPTKEPEARALCLELAHLLVAGTAIYLGAFPTGMSFRQGFAPLVARMGFYPLRERVALQVFKAHEAVRTCGGTDFVPGLIPTEEDWEKTLIRDNALSIGQRKKLLQLVRQHITTGDETAEDQWTHFTIGNMDPEKTAEWWDKQMKRTRLLRAKITRQKAEARKFIEPLSGLQYHTPNRELCAYLEEYAEYMYNNEPQPHIFARIPRSESKPNHRVKEEVALLRISDDEEPGVIQTSSFWKAVEKNELFPLLIVSMACLRQRATYDTCSKLPMIAQPTKTSDSELLTAFVTLQSNILEASFELHMWNRTRWLTEWVLSSDEKSSVEGVFEKSLPSLGADLPVFTASDTTRANLNSKITENNLVEAMSYPFFPVNQPGYRQDESQLQMWQELSKGLLLQTAEEDNGRWLASRRLPVFMYFAARSLDVLADRPEIFAAIAAQRAKEDFRRHWGLPPLAEGSAEHVVLVCLQVLNSGRGQQAHSWLTTAETYLVANTTSWVPWWGEHNHDLPGPGNQVSYVAAAVAAHTMASRFHSDNVFFSEYRPKGKRYRVLRKLELPDHTPASIRGLHKGSTLQLDRGATVHLSSEACRHSELGDLVFNHSIYELDFLQSFLNKMEHNIWLRKEHKTSLSKDKQTTTFTFECAAGFSMVYQRGEPITWLTHSGQAFEVVYPHEVPRALLCWIKGWPERATGIFVKHPHELLPRLLWASQPATWHLCQTVWNKPGGVSVTHRNTENTVLLLRMHPSGMFPVFDNRKDLHTIMTAASEAGNSECIHRLWWQAFAQNIRPEQNLRVASPYWKVFPNPAEVRWDEEDDDEEEEEDTYSCPKSEFEVGSQAQCPNHKHIEATKLPDYAAEYVQVTDQPDANGVLGKYLATYTPNTQKNRANIESKLDELRKEYLAVLTAQYVHMVYCDRLHRPEPYLGRKACWLHSAFTALTSLHKTLTTTRHESELAVYTRRACRRSLQRNLASGDLEPWRLLLENSGLFVTEEQQNFMRPASPGSPKVQHIGMGQGKSSVIVPALVLRSLMENSATNRRRHIIVVQPEHLTTVAERSIRDSLGALGRPLNVLLHRWKGPIPTSQLRGVPEVGPCLQFIHVVSDTNFKHTLLLLHTQASEIQRKFSLPALASAVIIHDEIDAALNPLQNSLNIPTGAPVPHPMFTNENTLGLTQYYETVVSLVSGEAPQEGELPELEPELADKLRADHQLIQKQMVLNVNYGRAAGADELLAVPYLAARQPAPKGTAFSDPDLRALLTCQQKWREGLSAGDFRLLQRHLRAMPFASQPQLLQEFADGLLSDPALRPKLSGTKRTSTEAATLRPQQKRLRSSRPVEGPTNNPKNPDFKRKRPETGRKDREGKTGQTQENTIMTRSRTRKQLEQEKKNGQGEDGQKRKFGSTRTDHVMTRSRTLLARQLSAAAEPAAPAAEPAAPAAEPLVSLVTAEPVTLAATDRFKFNRPLLRYYLTRVLFPSRLNFFENRLNISYQDALTADTGGTKVAFSGTVDTFIPNFALGPAADVAYDERTFGTEPLTDPISSAASDAAVLGGGDSEQLLPCPTAEKFFTAFSNDLAADCVIDAAALLYNMSTRQVAGEIFERRRDVGTFQFFDAASGKWVQIDRPNSTNESRRSVYYFEHRHTRGTDAVLPPLAKGLVTVGPTSTLTDVAQAVFRLRDVLNGQTAVLVPCGAAWQAGRTPATRGELFRLLKQNQQNQKSHSDLLAAVQNYKAYLRVKTAGRYFEEKTYYRLTTPSLDSVLINASENRDRVLDEPAFTKADEAFTEARGLLATAVRSEYQVETISEQDSEKDSEKDSEQDSEKDSEREFTRDGTNCWSEMATYLEQEDLLSDLKKYDHKIRKYRFFTPDLAEALQKLRFMIALSNTVKADVQPAGARLVVDYTSHIFICTTREFLARPFHPISGNKSVESPVLYNTRGSSLSDRQPSADWRVLLACVLAGGNLELKQEAQMLVGIVREGFWKPARIALQCFKTANSYGPLLKEMMTSNIILNSEDVNKSFSQLWKSFSIQQFQEVIIGKGVVLPQRVQDFIAETYNLISNILLP